MNEQQKIELVHYRLTKAKNTISEVEISIQNKLWNMSVNRLYYACFYAVTALLADINIFTKTHHGAWQMFGLHFVRQGKITAESSIFYGEIFDKRQKGDYEDFMDFSEGEVTILVAPAKKLIAEIETIIAENN